MLRVGGEHHEDTAYAMPGMECVGTFEQLFSHMGDWCPPPVRGTVLSIASLDLGLTASHQANRDKLDTNVFVPMDTDIACNGSTSAAPGVWDIYPNRHSAGYYRAEEEDQVIRRWGLMI